MRGKVRIGQPELLDQLGVELRLERADRDELAVGRLVRVVEGRARVEHVPAQMLLVERTQGPQAPRHRHERGAAVDHRRVDDLPFAR